MLEIPRGLPFGGTLVAEAYGSFAGISRDRGASWQISAFPASPNSQGPGAENLAVVLHGPRAGRIVGAGAWGLATSDDGGATFAPVPGLWQYFRFYGQGIAVLDRAAPGGGDRVVATVIDPQRPGRVCFVKVSDDGGDTWRETATLTSDPNGAAAEIVDMGGGRAVIVMNGGHVWQTDDAGETWRIVGVVPRSLVDPEVDFSLNPRVYWAFFGPDRRLYVGGSRLGGSNPGWTYRTTEPFVVAGEPKPAQGEASGLGVTVRPNPAGGRVEVVLTLAEARDVRVVVMDALGRDIAVVVDGPVAAGERVVGVDSASWPGGVYVVRATAAGGGGSGMQTVAVRLVIAR